MKIAKYIIFILLILILVNILNCKDRKNSENLRLNDFELKHGIGPIKELIELNKIDKTYVFDGKRIFETKCTSCHKLESDFIGPALGNIVELRSPEYILNMIVNPVDMTLYHPVARQQVEKFGSQMTIQNIKLNDAFKILDYLRYVNENDN